MIDPSLSARGLAERIKDEAAQLGFDACGIASVFPIDPEDRLGAWLTAGYHAEMAWIESSKAVRQDIQKFLPGARSVVVVARNYFAPRPPAPSASGRVSRYAWGRDYHRVLRPLVNRLARRIESLEPAAQCRSSIDAGPVLEKFWAARAGIGWIGKHSLVIHPTFGSWVFLAVLATTVELTPDPPAQDRCGACTRCIDACPTSAIVAFRSLDARRCISYHTVESRAPMPGHICEKAGDWLFGCDLCQEACPFNQNPIPSAEPAFHPREGVANPDVTKLSSLTEEGFRETFAGSPVIRARFDGIRRRAQALLMRVD